MEEMAMAKLPQWFEALACRTEKESENHEFSHHCLVPLLGLLGVSRSRLGLAERAYRGVPVYLLVARQARLHRWRLLPEKE